MPCMWFDLWIWWFDASVILQVAFLYGTCGLYPMESKINQFNSCGVWCGVLTLVTTLLETCLGTEKLQLLQDAWSQCAGEWKRSELYKRMIDRTTHSAHGARVWLTRSQIQKKYDSETLGNEICDSKMNDPELRKTHTKEHPDAPGLEARILCWPLVHVVDTKSITY